MGSDNHDYGDADLENAWLLKGKPQRPWAGTFIRRLGLHLMFALSLLSASLIIVLPAMSKGHVAGYGQYYIGPSNIPGAGLGVFARHDMKAGTIWNAEDGKPASAIFLNKQQSNSIMGLARYLKNAGYTDHPVIHMVTFMDTYGYSCSNSSYAISLSASTFANHAPEPPRQPQPGPKPPTANAHHHHHQQQQRRRNPRGITASPSKPSSILVGPVANCGGLPEAPWVERLTPLEQCALSITIRDVKAGEELFEDYRRYCDEGASCPDMALQPDSDSFISSDKFAAGITSAGRRRLLGGFDRDDDDAVKPDALSLRQQLLQIQGVQLANSSVPGGAAKGLGLFATRDVPAGTVWNKEDAEYSLVITRAQWDTLMRMQSNLRRLGVIKPIVNNFVDALRALGYCCPNSDSLYIPLTTSLLANMGHQHASHKSPGGISNRRITTKGIAAAAKTHATGLVNAHLTAYHARGKGGEQELSTMQSCTWSKTLHAIKRGEEILDDRRSHLCHWPGLLPCWGAVKSLHGTSHGWQRS